METAERTIRNKNKNVTDENMEQFLDDYLDENQRRKDIEEEAYGLDYLNEDYDDGNFNGYDAPEEETDDYMDYN
jgi:hypothetical protein